MDARRAREIREWLEAHLQVPDDPAHPFFADRPSDSASLTARKLYDLEYGGQFASASAVYIDLGHRPGTTEEGGWWAGTFHRSDHTAVGGRQTPMDALFDLLTLLVAPTL